MVPIEGTDQEASARSQKRQPARESSVLVLAKAVAILDVLAGARDATASELSEILDEPRSTVYRLLGALAELDVVEPGARRGTYRLGLHLLRLGSAVVARLDVRVAARPVMERIHDETGETVFLCVRRGREAVCIERIDGRRTAVVVLKVGGSLPLHVGAAPRVLLAFDRRSAWEAYVEHAPLTRAMGDGEFSRSEVLAALEEARRTGIAISDEDFVAGFAAVGAPIFDHTGSACAALSISGARSAVLGEHEQHVRRLLVDGAREASRSLGHEAAWREPVE